MQTSMLIAMDSFTADSLVVAHSGFLVGAPLNHDVRRGMRLYVVTGYISEGDWLSLKDERLEPVGFELGKDRLDEGRLG